MPNSKTHMLSGTILGGLVMIGSDLRKRMFNPIKILLGIGISALASRLPDILEPATSPNHRRFFHSVAFLALVTIACCGVWKKLQRMGEERETESTALSELVVTLFLVGLLCVVLHLILDSSTRKSLPII